MYNIPQAHGTKVSYITAMVTDDTGHKLITAGCDGTHVGNSFQLFLKL